MVRSSRPSSALPSSHRASPWSPLRLSVLLAGAPCSVPPARAGRHRTLVWELCWMYVVVPQLHVDPKPPWSFPATRLQASSQLAPCSMVVVLPCMFVSLLPPMASAWPQLAALCRGPCSHARPWLPTRLAQISSLRVRFSAPSRGLQLAGREPLPMAAVPSSSPAP
jgi:hypothetical protein